MATYIYQLKEKIEGMQRIMFDAGDFPSNTQAAFLEHCDIEGGTYRSRITESSVTKPFLDCLVSGCGFDPTKDVWIDSNKTDSERRNNICKDRSDYDGVDTAENFLAYFERLKNPDHTQLLCMDDDVPEVHDLRMVSLEMKDAKSNHPVRGELALNMLLVVRNWYHESGYEYGFNQLKIAMDLSKCKNARASDILALDAEHEFDDGILSWRSTKFEPIWMLTAKEFALSGQFESHSPVFCSLEKLIEGDQVVVTVEVDIRNGEIRREDGGSAVVRQDEKPVLGQNKKAIIRQLICKAVDPNVRETGKLVLARQKLNVRGQ